MFIPFKYNYGNIEKTSDSIDPISKECHCSGKVGTNKNINKANDKKASNKDIKFKNWHNTKTGSTSYLIFSILSVLCSFKVINIIFCKLFDAKIFKAKLQHPSRLFYLHLMSFFALPHSIWAIVMAAYNLYYTTNIASMLFFISIDVVILSLL